MFTNTDVDISEFVKITSAGVQIANFPQIRSALIDRYKSVYGSDIDLSTASADGIFINDLALIINNLCMSIQTFYANMDVDNASGVYLDALCKLANVTRKPATKSNASLQLINKGDAVYELTKGTIFVDKAGTEWIYNGSTIPLPANQTEATTITVECSITGPVKADAGWIDQTLLVSNIDVSQPISANIGSEEESDNDLRDRRNQSAGAQGTTVLDSLIGSLLQISGIDDVLIYNAAGTAKKAADNTSIGAHSIYVILRQQAGVTIDDSIIGKLIYEKLTPGISTTPTAVSSDAHSYKYIPEVFGSKVTTFDQFVYWKKATPIHNSITIEIIPLDYFSTDELPTVFENICSYLNTLPLSTQIDKQQLLIQAVYADPQFKSKATYTVKEVVATNLANPDTYFDYKADKCSYEKSGNNYILTIGG